MSSFLLHLAESSPFTLQLLEYLFAHEHHRYSNERLRVTVGGVVLEHPVMMAAGFDKQGLVVEALWQLGFSAIEVGSVLQDPQPGNPKPRLFRVAPGVLLNRMGFNSPGMREVKENLKRYRQKGIPIGISIGKNANVPLQDAPQVHAAVAAFLAAEAAYVVINVSSPNTLGLRALQNKEFLTDNVQAVKEALEAVGTPRPIFVKIAPDLPLVQVDDVIDVCLANGLAGIIATNTTNDPDVKSRFGERWRGEAGGISGYPVRDLATERIGHIYEQAGDRLDIIGVGGIHSTQDALQKLQAGAKAIQLWTGFVDPRYGSGGPSLPSRINRELTQWMDRQGVRKISDIVGKSSRTEL